MNPRVWLISTPCESEFLGYSGEPTSILYAAAVLWDDVRAGRIPVPGGGTLHDEDVRLFAWRVLSERVFAEVEEAARRAPPRVACLSATTPTTGHAQRLAQIIKRCSPGTFILFGGPHEDEIGRIDEPGAARLDAVDASVAGDGEYILAALVGAAVARDPFDVDDFLGRLANLPADLATVPGSWQLTLRSVAGRPSVRLPLVSNRLPAAIPNLPRALLARDRPGLARSFPIFDGPRGAMPTAQIITERGCAWRCSFCTEWRGTAAPGGHHRPLDDVIAEIDEAKTLGYGAVFFDDSTMFTGFGTARPDSHSSKSLGNRREFIRDLFAYLETTGLEWGCQTRVDTIEPDLVVAARRAGCTYIYFGAESASEIQLEDMHKEQSRAEIVGALDLVRHAGIRIGLSMLFGMPSADDPLWTREDEQTAETSLAFFADEVRKGGVAVISRNLTAFYPGATRTYMYAKVRAIDLWSPRPLASDRELTFPWNRFEDGGGHHARNVTAELATAIVRRSEELLGPWLIKAYIHPHPLDEAGGGRPLIDLVHDCSTTRANTGGPRSDAASDRPLSFDDALRAALATLDPGSADGRRRPALRIVVVGMHILESIRRIAYLGTEADTHWLPIWDALDEERLHDALGRLCIPPVDAVVVPAVLPETGVVPDFERLRRHLVGLGFNGRLVVDWSDATALVAEGIGAARRDAIVSLIDPGRILDDDSSCLTIDGDPDGAWLDAGSSDLTNFASHCRVLRAKMIEELSRDDIRPQFFGDPDSILAPHILAIRLVGIDQFALVKRLWGECNVLCTFIGPGDLIRFQFGWRTTVGEIQATVAAFVDLLPACRLTGPVDMVPSRPRIE